MFGSKAPQLESTRYYYSDDKIFEKSLDVVRPKKKNEKSSTNNNNPPLPIVVLVVGSAWLGHRAFVYTGTSWWNASGPKTIASLGTTCVCIRHRGAFCVLPPISVLAQVLVLVLAVVWAGTGGQWDVAVAVTGGLATFLALLALGGRGSAQLEDMLEDVSEALKWVQSHRELLEPPKATAIAAKETKTTDNTPATTAAPLSENSTSLSTSEESEEEENEKWSAITPLVFGGYSSGGHVAITLLHQPERFQKHGLPTPDKLFQAILIISGMMAVRPEQITVEDCQSKESVVLSTPQEKPRWCTSLVMQTIWGPDKERLIISPLAQPKPPPALPHLLIGNRNEVFGLPWLDIFFSSSAYRDRVKALTGAPAKYVEVESDHWFILSSTVLRNALQEELPKLLIVNNN